MKKYFNYQVSKVVTVKNLITIEYLDIGEEFSYPEEAHDFQEFVYVDRGEIHCHAGGEAQRLTRGDFLLIPPQSAHSYIAVAGVSAALFIVCFRSNSEILTLFREKIALDEEGRRMLAQILAEAKNAFSFPFVGRLKVRTPPAFGAQQLVENGIERLLIHLARALIDRTSEIRMVMNSGEVESNLVSDVIHLLKENLGARITLDEISRHTFYSKTFLNGIFKKNTGRSIMKYYTELKIGRAKELLRSGASPADVSVRLGFESASYFTKVFKKQTGLTPTAYRKSIL